MKYTAEQNSLNGDERKMFNNYIIFIMNNDQYVRYILFFNPFIEVADERNDLASQNIAEIDSSIKHACDEYSQICMNNSKLIENLKFDTRNRHENAPIQFICNEYACKEKVRLLINYDIPEESIDDTQWVLNNSIHFIVKCNVNDNNRTKLWCKSNEGYSALIYSDIHNLEQIILDILLDIGIEYKVLSSAKFKSKKKNIHFLDLISNKKMEFSENDFTIEERNDGDLSTYCSFSSFFRKSAEEYDLNKIHQYWIKYLLGLTDELKYILKINGVDELIKKLLSGKQHGGLNKRQIIKKFKDKCPQPGYYIYVRLKKSIIGLSYERKARVKAILGGNGKTINKCTFIPLVYMHEINNMYDLFDACIFEYKL